MTKDNNPVPEHESGARSDVSHTIKGLDSADTANLFTMGMQRLKNVNHWHEYSEGLSARFFLTDEHGNNITREPQQGDYFRIEIPGPKTETGKGADWVRIEMIDVNADPIYDESLVIRVRPAEKPGETDTAHFFKDDATSSFLLGRHGLEITMSVHGRNEKPNTTPGKIVDMLRNAVVGTGAAAGFSKIQWNKLVRGILKTD